MGTEEANGMCPHSGKCSTWFGLKQKLRNKGFAKQIWQTGARNGDVLAHARVR